LATAHRDDGRPAGRPSRASDAAWMARALALAERGRGHTSPNPMVGAVLVRDGKVVGEGWHQAPGTPHAEAAALAGAGEAARGATLYVTLEPCAHSGRTPPCAEALVAAEVARVVAALVDPDPRVDGAGFRRLHAAGIELSVGDSADVAAEQNAAYLVHRRFGRPRITCKAAASLDGKVMAADGSSQWITGPAARADAHRLRAEADAIVVGSGTALADDPRLTARPPNLEVTHPPLRVLVDTGGRVPATARLFSPGAPTLVATTGRAPAGARDAWAHAGAEVLILPQGPHGVDLVTLVRALGERGILELMVEGGPTLQSSLWAAGLVDRLVWYLAPIVLGGARTPGLVPGVVAPTLAAARQLQIAVVRPVGPDLRVIAYPRPVAHAPDQDTSAARPEPAAPSRTL
jgi:diaminohydroxyphosphoribosylaminopyrimidine deaminase/5-amino-6-(5-phosphoribosylamino)uracil reductase